MNTRNGLYEWSDGSHMSFQVTQNFRNYVFACVTRPLSLVFLSHRTTSAAW